MLMAAIPAITPRRRQKMVRITAILYPIFGVGAPYLDFARHHPDTYAMLSYLQSFDATSDHAFVS
jgi:hypothetical protein